VSREAGTEEMSAQRDGQTTAELSSAKQALLRSWMRGSVEARASSPTIPRREAGTTAPLSFSQLRLWFLDKLVPNSPAYNIPVALRLRGHLDADALERAIAAIVRRHEVLHTSFQEFDGEPIQLILPNVRPSFERIDLSGMEQDARAALISAQIALEARTPFDLERDLPMRARLLRSSDHEHALLLTWSHLVADGWSAAIFSRELAHLYKAYVERSAPTLPELPLQYADFALWQRESLTGEMLDRQLSYWREHLEGAPTILNLPTDRPRPVIQSFRGEAIEFALRDGLARELELLAGREDATLFMVLLAAFGVLLNRYTGQADLLVGTPVANRRRPELEGLIGFFANTLVLRTDLSGDPSFEELIARVRRSTVGAYSHQELPFEKLVEELHPDRSMSHNPLFQAMFVLNNTPAPETELADGLTMSRIEAHAGTAKFDLWLSISPVGDGLVGMFEYASDLYDRATVEHMLAFFQALLKRVVEDASRPVSELISLSERERALIVDRWSGTDVAYEPPHTLHTLVEQQAARTPDAEAVRLDDGATLTYLQLNRWANRLGRRLRALGVGPDALVGVFAERSPELVVALLAVLKAGGAYVPLDPTYPAERLAYMLEDSQTQVVLTHSDVRASLPAFAGSVLVLDEDDCSSEDDGDLGETAQADHAAYVIYTSGSTGRPKGVVNAHRAIVNRLRWMQDEYRLTSADTVLQKTPSSFDVSVWEFFWPLIAGARIVLAAPEGHRDPDYLVRLITRENVTTLHFVPSMLRLFLEHDDLERCTSLRRVICSGEALALELQERFFARLSATLYNLYGPTEAAVDVTHWRCEPESGRSSVPIGHPIANARIYIVDERLQPVPVGVPGELLIGGVCVARGYHRRPQLTAERFVEDSLGQVRSGRLYRTGDLVRWSSDGVIEFLGRRDSQVKLHGIRIELGEIEAALRTHPVVRDCVVIVHAERGDGRSDQRLVAYVLPAAEAGADASAEDSANAASGASPNAATTLNSAREQVSEWSGVFDDAYARDEEDGTFNIAGWTSSYTSKPLPSSEMREWLERTVEQILLLQPRRVLEIGCGTGLLLFAIAPSCESYAGIDVSETGLASIRRTLEQADLDLPQVELAHAAAHELDHVSQGSVDTVVLNSVVQYFPNVEYLVEVLSQALDKLTPEGRLFIGDVRSRPLLEAFHASVELHRAPPEMTLERLRARIGERVERERELVLDPALFGTLLARLLPSGHVEIRLKRGSYENELSRFRYDLIIHKSACTRENAQPQRLSWDEHRLDTDGLRERLSGGRAPSLLVTGIPNARLDREALLVELLAGDIGGANVADARQALAVGRPSSVDPMLLGSIGEELGYEVDLAGDAQDPTSFQALFRHAGGAPLVWPPSDDDRPWSAYANRPSRQRRIRELIPEWRRHLKATLPDYMVPSSFVAIDAIPLTPNGKLDHDALPPALPPIDLDAELVAPRNASERELAQIWMDVLDLDRVGVNTNYFELGGDSIRGVQIVSRAAQAGLGFALRDLFQYPTIEELALRAGKGQASTDDVGRVSLSARDARRRAELLLDPHVEDAYPLAPFQQHMLEGVLANPSPGLFLVQRVEDLCGAIDVGAFRWAWEQLPEHFPILRTSFTWEDVDSPLQVLHRTATTSFAYEDWRELNGATRDTQLRAYLRRDRDLGCAPGEPAGMRLLMAQLDSETFRTVLSFAYLQVDGWSLGLFTAALLELYTHRLAGSTPAIAEAPPYSAFAQWAQARGAAPDTRAFWQRTLRGFHPTPLLDALSRSRAHDASAETVGFARRHLYLPANATRALQELAQRRGLTPNVLAQLAWAAVLSSCTGERDVSFGMFVNGRASEISGIDSLPGPTMNLLPLCVRGLTSAESVAGALEQLLAFAIELGRHEHVSQRTLRELAGLPESGQLFDSYMVFQNLNPESFRSTQRITPFFSRMGHPLRIDVFPGVELAIAISYHREQLDDAAAALLLSRLALGLDRIATAADAPLAEIVAELASDDGSTREASTLISEDVIASSEVQRTPVVPSAGNGS
jgi:amino acid adenylation domain-containing protein